MRDVFFFSSAKEIIFGKGAIRHIPFALRQMNVKKPLIVSGKHVGQSSIRDAIESVLNQADVDFVFWTGAEPEPKLGIASKAAKVYRENNCDCIVGVGGGSAIDVSKGAAVMATYDGDPVQYFGEHNLPGPVCPIIAIPTTAGTGTEVTSVAVLENEKTGIKAGFSDNRIRPDFALVDPTLTLSLPPFLTATTGMDALGHAMEAYLAVDYKYLPAQEEQVIFSGSNPVTDILAEKAISLIASNLRTAVFQGQNEEARYNMSMASMLAGLAFGSAGLGLDHAFSYPLAYHSKQSHGVLIGLMLPSFMEYNVMIKPDKLKKVAIMFGENVSGLSSFEAAYKAVEAVRRLQQELGIPSRLADIGIGEDKIDDICEKTLGMGRLIRASSRRVGKEDLEASLRKIL